MSGLIKKQTAIDALVDATKQPGAYGYIDTKTITNITANLSSIPDCCVTWRFVYYAKETNK